MGVIPTKRLNELQAERRRLQHVLSNEALRADARAGDSDARRVLDEAAAGVAETERQLADDDQRAQDDGDRLSDTPSADTTHKC